MPICIHKYTPTYTYNASTQYIYVYIYAYIHYTYVHTHNVSRLCCVMFFSFMLGCLSCQSKAVKQLYDVKCAKVNTLIRPDGQLVIGVFRV